jgi:hypothetical protein
VRSNRSGTMLWRRGTGVDGAQRLLFARGVLVVVAVVLGSGLFALLVPVSSAYQPAGDQVGASAHVKVQHRVFSMWVSGEPNPITDNRGEQKVVWDQTQEEHFAVCTYTTKGEGHEVLYFASKPHDYRLLAQGSKWEFEVNSRNEQAMGEASLVWHRFSTLTYKGCMIDKSAPTTDCREPVDGTARFFPIADGDEIAFDLLYPTNPYLGTSKQFACPFLFNLDFAPLAFASHWNGAVSPVTRSPVKLSTLLNLKKREELAIPDHYKGDGPGVCANPPVKPITCSSSVTISWILHIKRVS